MTERTRRAFCSRTHGGWILLRLWNEPERQADKGAAELEDEADSGKGHDSREGGKVGAAPNGLPVPAAREEVTWPAGYCAIEAQDGGVCAWLLLASAPGLQELHNTDEQPEILGGEAGGKRCARQGPA